MLNPINHARSAGEVERYKVEPYVVAADVYSVPPHVGRGGWTWYTGSAGWMYRADIEGVLGIRREGANIVVDPCIPAAWPGFEARLIIESTTISIRVWNPYAGERADALAILDGLRLESTLGGAAIPLDGSTHCLVLGGERRSAHRRYGIAFRRPA